MADDTSFAIVLVDGEGASTHAAKLKKHFSAKRSVTSVDDLRSGDLLLLDSVPEAWNDATLRPWWACTNVLLLADNRAPIVRRVSLADALAEIS